MILASFVLIGCKHGVSDKDFVGTWMPDPASPEKADHPEVRSKLVFNLLADHTFTMSTPTPAGFEGTWKLQEGTRKVGLTPTTLVIENPLAKGQTTKMPIGDAMQRVEAMGGNPKMIEELKKASTQATFELSEDGKKMTENGQPALVRSGG